MKFGNEVCLKNDFDIVTDMLQNAKQMFQI
jgi:hypothetical protein